MTARAATCERRACATPSRHGAGSSRASSPSDATNPSERIRQAIGSAQSRRLYSQRIATIEPVFANIRHHKRMSRFTLRGTQGRHAVASVLPGAQHREAGEEREALRALQGRINAH